MPTIVLRHVTKQYHIGERIDLGPLERIASSTVSFFDSSAAHAHRSPSDLREPPDRLNALDDLTLTIRDGETLAILGPSGCGKTTLLRAIAGLSKIDIGDITYDTVPINEIPIAERGIGMVFQNYALYPHMPAYDNIGFYDLVRKQPEKIPERIHTIVDVMGIDIRHLLSRKPPTLSGGEQQRVAVARCLARDPKLFLFDEPLSNLDAKLRGETRVQIKRLLQHYRITAVYVTHDQTEAIALADRIAIMSQGKIVQSGTFQALYDAPKNAFIAQFFGTPPMNLFLGHIFNETWEGSGFTVHPVRPGLRQGQAVHLGIRPEHVELAETGIPARVVLIEPLLTQQRQLVHAEIARKPCVINLDRSVEITRGQQINLRFPSGYLYFFDGKTGTRIG